jgi:hypothetical protein
VTVIVVRALLDHVEAVEHDAARRQRPGEDLGRGRSRVFDPVAADAPAPPPRAEGAP